MKHKTILISATSILLIILISACAQSAATPITNEDAQVEAMINEKCGKCHKASRVFQQNLTQEE